MPRGVAATKPSGLQDTIAINSGTTINGWLANIKANLVQTPGKLNKRQRDLLHELEATTRVENRPQRRTLLGKVKDIFG